MGRVTPPIGSVVFYCDANLMRAVPRDRRSVQMRGQATTPPSPTSHLHRDGGAPLTRLALFLAPLSYCEIEDVGGRVAGAGPDLIFDSIRHSFLVVDIRGWHGGDFELFHRVRCLPDAVFSQQGFQF